MLADALGAARRHRAVARLRLRRQRHRSHPPGLRRVQAARRQVRRQRAGAGEERAARLPAARAVHPLFGAMPSTPLALELQITKEYLGEDTHLAYLGPLFEEVLKSDTYAKGAGVDGGAGHRRHRARLRATPRSPASPTSAATPTGPARTSTRPTGTRSAAWRGTPTSSAQTVADEWIRQTFSNDPVVVAPVTKMMMESRQTLVNYMDAARAGAHHGHRPSLRSGAVGQQPQHRELEPVLLSQGRRHRDRLRSHREPAATRWRSTPRRCATSSRTAPPCPTTPAVLPARAAGTTSWPRRGGRSGRAGLPLQRRRRRRADDARRLDDGAGADRQPSASTTSPSFLQIQHYEARWWRDACLQYFASVNKQGDADRLRGARRTTCRTTRTCEPTCPSRRDQAPLHRVYTGNPSPAITK